MRSKNRPHEYIVFTDKPGYGGGYTCKVRTLKIPRGRTYREMVDVLPPTVGKLAVVSAYSASTAREAAAETRGVRCAASGLGMTDECGDLFDNKWPR